VTHGLIDERHDSGAVEARDEDEDENEESGDSDHHNQRQRQQWGSWIHYKASKRVQLCVGILVCATK